MTIDKRSCTAVLALAAGLWLSLGTTRPAEIVVEGACTLSAAVDAANQDDDGNGLCPPGGEPGEDTVRLTYDVELLEPDHSDSGSTTTWCGLPRITTTVIIDGDGHSIRRADLAPPFRIFDVYEGALTLRDLTVRNGTATFGGAISSYAGRVTLQGTTLEMNNADGYGGAIASYNGWVEIERSVLRSNVAGGVGGAISAYAYPTGPGLEVRDSAFSGNEALNGGAIAMAGGVRLEIDNSVFAENQAVGDGGAIFAGGTLESVTEVAITRTLVTDNSAVGSGGGLDVSNLAGVSAGHVLWVRNRSGGEGGAIRARGPVTLTDNTLVANSSYGFGGGLYAETDAVILRRSTLSGNVAYGGGGLALSGDQMPAATAHILDSTISGNMALDYGGGIDTYKATAIVTRSTVTDNTAPLGSGLNVEATSSVTVDNSIVAGNHDSPDCAGAYVSAGVNFSDDPSCLSALPIVPGVDFDSLLADNGGPTLTHALPAMSPALDAAGDCGSSTDQRGYARLDGACDSGAFELGAQACALICGDGELLTGVLSELRVDASCRRAACVPRDGQSPGAILCSLPDPAPNDGQYYLGPDGESPLWPPTHCGPVP